MPDRLKMLAILLSTVTLLCVGVEFTSAWLVLPAPDTDGAGFVPAAVYFARTGQLANPIYKLAWFADPLHGDRFVYHGPLFPWLVGSLAPEPTPRGAFLVIAVFRSAALVGLAVCCFLLIRPRAAQMARWRLVVLGAAASMFLFAEAGMRLPIVGRPESLCEIFVLAAAAAWMFLPARAACLAAAGCLGLLAATHPLGAVVLGMFTACVLAWRSPAPKAALAMLAIGAGAASLAAAIMAASPNGLIDTLHGEWINTQYLQSREWHGLRWALVYLFLQWENFFYFAFFVLALFLTVYLRPDMLAGLGRRWALLLVAALTVPVIWYVTLRDPTTGYNLAMFSPAVFIVLTRLLADASVGSGRRFAFAGAAAIFCAMISSLAIAKRGADVVAALRTGTTYDRGRDLVRRTLPAQGCVLVDFRSWPLFDDYDRVREIAPGIDEDRHRPDVVGCRPGESVLPLLLRPAGADCSAWATPGTSKIIADGRTDVRPTLFGLTTSKFPAGYPVCLARQTR